MPPKRRDKVLLRTVSHEAKSSRKWEVPLSVEELPDAKTQRDIMEDLTPDEEDHEAFYYEYAVCKYWYKVWRKYIGCAENKSPGQTIPPGPIEMSADRKNNKFIKGYIWKKLLEWYGLDDNHELDRRYIGENDDETLYEGKTFEICVLSPMVPMLHKRTKTLDMKEYVGYIECQIRRILKLPNHSKTRLWICEKGFETEFVMLKDRTEELWFSHGIADSKTYVLGIEVCGENGVWPTGQHEEVEGDLELFTEVTRGHKCTQKWKEGLTEELDDFTDTCFTQVKGFMERYLQGMHQREDKRIKELLYLKSVLQKMMSNNDEFCLSLHRRSAKLHQDEAHFETVKETFHEKEGEFNSRKKTFEEEIKYLEELNKITDNVIKLNVGGHVFMTSTLTLTRDPDSMLAAMFSGRHHLYKTQDGAVFIDRDGTHFRHILNFLRDGFLRHGTLPDSENVVQELIAEAEYYQLQGFLDYLQGETRHQESSTDLEAEFICLAGIYDSYEDL